MRTYGLVLLLVAAQGCSPEVAIGPTGLQVFPTQLYTGVDDGGGHYVVPVAARGETGLMWNTADTSRIMIMGTDNGAMVTALRAGHAQIEVDASASSSVSVSISVQSYTAAQRAAGQEAVGRIGCQRTYCHDANGPDFTPSGIGRYADLDLQAWILYGKSLRNGTTVQFHMWPLTLTEQMGIVAYLRSQAPRGMPAF